MNEVGHIKSSHTCHWRVPNWSQLRLGIEYSSPPLLFDDLKWSIKLVKGKTKTPDVNDYECSAFNLMLSIYVQIHETSPGSLRGIRKNVQLTLKINNTNPSSYYNDFGVGKRLQPVWFSEKHTKWGEDSLGTLSSIIPFLSRDQVSLSVNITILKSEVNNMTAATPTDIITSPPFSRYIDSKEFSDISFKVLGNDSVENFRIFYGHKNILAAISPWFNIIFTNGMKESLENEITISDVKHDIFYRLLKYCYTFKIDIDDIDDAYEMLKASDRFQISNIREESLRFLRQELNEDNIWDIWECADMYGCEKTINTCNSYASVEMKALIAHPSWLYAQPRVIKMALEIGEGDLPAETELYKAVLLWAKQRLDKITIIDDTKEDVEKLSMTRTQLLASVVDVEPLAISSAVVEPDDDDEEEQKHSLDREVHVTHVTNRVIAPLEPHDLEIHLASILQSIRFPMMPPAFLANKIESDSFIMNIEGMRDMLYEAYKYHAVLGTSSSIRCQPRKPQAEDEL
ncbi:uncharacterized protein EV154DRAFT_547250 [Mucor mucedo]|uniref:uncharacterized protein n=1 Tax=Mucor mucedo TaxID=29922 RepID=UPI00221ED4FC|nr:uncharacterized protein EV154DRAFT_547250 [Mucor mucedo]KAI7896598.1 hypothetical protein EV154DRAFT_547250 [Mucor mucedo]